MHSQRSSAAFAASLLSVFIAAGCDSYKPPAPAYTVSGSVTGPKVDGVNLSLGGDTTKSGRTNSAGNFAFPGTPNGSYTLTPSLTGYTFTPPSLTVEIKDGSVSGQNFTIVAVPTYKVSGTIAGVVVTGVKLTLSTSPTVSATSDATGKFSVSGAKDGTYTLTPSLDGYTFTPATASVTVSGADVTAVNFTSAHAKYTLTGQVTGAGRPVTVRLSGDATAVVQSDASGNYTFADLLNGKTYTVKPSMTGRTFSPATASATIALANKTGVNFAATAVGGTVATATGTLTYAGTKTGRVQVAVTCADGTSLDRGTSLAAVGAFTVRGIQCGSFPTTARVNAWIDTLGIGRHILAADPFATKTVTLSSSTSAIDFGTLAIADPAALASPPPTTIRLVVGMDSAAAVIFSPIRNSNGEELVKGYKIYWSSTVAVPGPGSSDGSLAIPPGPNFAAVTGLTNGTAYNFSVAGVSNTDVETTPGGFPGGAVTANAPTGPFTISGTVTFGNLPAGTNTLYVVAQAAAGNVRVARYVNPVSPQAYSIPASPDGYQVLALMDVGNNGVVSVGDPNEFAKTDLPVAITAGTNVANLNLTLPSAPVVVTATLRENVTWFMDVLVLSNLKVPVAAQVTSGPNVVLPIDLAVRHTGLGSRDQNPVAEHLLEWSFDPAVPVAGDSFTVHVTYSDGTSQDFTVAAQ